MRTELHTERNQKLLSTESDTKSFWHQKLLVGSRRRREHTAKLLVRQAKHYSQSQMACELARMGYLIFPIDPASKMPLIPWMSRASCNVPEVTDWWERFPDDNIGINCGESGLLVIDLDNRAAMETLDDLWREHEGRDLSCCGAPIIRTRRGWHLYFEQPEVKLGNTASYLAPGIDTRGVGGMVVAPGSVVKGARYHLADGDLTDIPPLPGWLADRVRPARRRLTVKEIQQQRRLQWPQVAKAELMKYCAKIVMAPDGQQNKTIYKSAFYLTLHVGATLGLQEIEDELLAAAERGNHPRTRARQTISSAMEAALAAMESEAANDGRRC